MGKSGVTVIGLTGSIGMGKSETARMFARAGVPVFDSDAAVHDLMAPGGAAVAPVVRAFPGVDGQDGIDRKKLGARVFGDREKLERLESILHPLVAERRQAFFEAAQKDGHAMVVADVPLLFETGGEQACDYTVVVSAAPEVQRARVLARPGMTPDRLAAILEKQMPDGEKRRRADFVVQTDRGFDYAEQQVRDIIRKIEENRQQRETD